MPRIVHVQRFCCFGGATHFPSRFHPGGLLANPGGVSCECGLDPFDPMSSNQKKHNQLFFIITFSYTFKLSFQCSRGCKTCNRAARFCSRQHFFCENVEVPESIQERPVGIPEYQCLLTCKGFVVWTVY